jgi:hypothetical protein
MLLIAVQIGIVFVVAAYFAAVRSRMLKRNLRSWESLIGRIEPMGCLQSISDHFPWREGLNASPEDTWEKIDGIRGLRRLYRNAGVLMEIADFAALHGESVDRILLETLRNDALQIRLGVLTTISQAMWNKASETARVHGFRIVSIYIGMSSRMTALLQASSVDYLPTFVAAM